MLAVNFATSGYVPQATEFTEVENVRPKVTNANEEKVDSVSEKQSPVVVSTENSVKTAEKSDSSPVASMATSVSTTGKFIHSLFMLKNIIKYKGTLTYGASTKSSRLKLFGC